MVEMKRVVYIFQFLLIFMITESCSFSFFGGGDYDGGGGKYKCYSTYELVEVWTYDTHYDEVRQSIKKFLAARNTLWF